MGQGLPAMHPELSKEVKSTLELRLLYSNTVEKIVIYMKRKVIHHLDQKSSKFSSSKYRPSAYNLGY